MSKIIAAFITTFKLSVHPVPWTEDLRPRTGVTRAVSNSGLDACSGAMINRLN